MSRIIRDADRGWWGEKKNSDRLVTKILAFRSKRLRLVETDLNRESPANGQLLTRDTLRAFDNTHSDEHTHGSRSIAAY